MEILTFDKIDEMITTLTGVIDNVYTDDPLLDEDEEVKISENLSIPVRSLVGYAISSCRDSFDRDTAEFKRVKRQIQEEKERIATIETTTRREELRKRQIGRVKESINSKKKLFENSSGITTEQSIYRTYAQFFSKIGYIHNKMKHEGISESWDNKHSSMWRAFSYALLGEMEGFNIRLDENGDRCFNTPITIPIPGSRNPVELHFGSEQNYYDFLVSADSFLGTVAKERPELAYRAKLQLRYADKQSTLERDVIIPDEIKAPAKGSDKEKVQIAFLRYSELKSKYDVEKNKYRSENKKNLREKQLLKMQRLQSRLSEVMKELRGLRESIEDFNEYVMDTPTLRDSEEINKNVLIEELPEWEDIKSKKDAIELLKRKPNDTERIKALFGNNQDAVSFIELLEEMRGADDIEKKKQLARLLMYRCVGIGTEGDDAFFPYEADGKTQVEQICDFVKSQGIDMPNLQEQIELLFEEKRELIENGWDLGTEPLTKNGFAQILKNGMMSHGMSFDDVNVAIDRYRRLDMFYGRDENKSIDIVSWKVAEVLDESRR